MVTGNETPDEINAMWPDKPPYSCYGCHVTHGLHWFRGTSMPICSRQVCIDKAEDEWQKAMYPEDF